MFSLAAATSVGPGAGQRPFRRQEACGPIRDETRPDRRHRRDRRPHRDNRPTRLKDHRDFPCRRCGGDSENARCAEISSRCVRSGRRRRRARRRTDGAAGRNPAGGAESGSRPVRGWWAGRPGASVRPESLRGVEGVTGRTDEERDAAALVVGRVAFAVFQMLAQPFAMVGGEDDNGVFRDAQLIERAEQAADVKVHFAYLAVVALSSEPQLVVGIVLRPALRLDLLWEGRELKGVYVVEVEVVLEALPRGNGGSRCRRCRGRADRSGPGGA